MAKQGGRPVLLDATELGGADFLARRFPTIDAALRERGFDWSKEPIPVTPAAHYWMGGVRTDVWGRTSVPGLYAVGEVACTGVHGANRLASNSLLESLVFAWRCAEQLPKDDTRTWPVLESSAKLIAVDSEPHPTAKIADRAELEIACAMVRMALRRCESRGAHFRVDYPETSAEFAHPLVCAAAVRKVAVCL
jgi:L-aspartate oxidase